MSSIFEKFNDQPNRRTLPDDDDYLLQDDSTFTFRINTHHKAEFLKLCKQNRFSAASVLKRHIIKCLEEGEL